MGLGYRVYLFDEMDWGYANSNFNDTKSQMEKIFPDCDLLAKIYGVAIFDIGKNLPNNMLGKKIVCDYIMCSNDNEIMPIEYENTNGLIERYGIHEME